MSDKEVDQTRKKGKRFFSTLYAVTFQVKNLKNN